jgi:excisionase family DNA binding protein
MSSLAEALLRELDDEALDVLAERLAPRLAAGAPIDDRWLRGAERIAAYIDAPRSRVYALASAGRIPVERDGSNLIARRSDLDAWVRAGGGKRP